jgi:hypothetical protein
MPHPDILAEYLIFLNKVVTEEFEQLKFQITHELKDKEDVQILNILSNYYRKHQFRLGRFFCDYLPDVPIDKETKLCNIDADDLDELQINLNMMGAADPVLLLGFKSLSHYESNEEEIKNAPEYIKTYEVRFLEKWAEFLETTYSNITFHVDIFSDIAVLAYLLDNYSEILLSHPHMKNLEDGRLYIISDEEYLNDPFVLKDSFQYLQILTKTTPPILSIALEFIGNKNVHKGVFCSYIKKLQNDGIIKKSCSRQELAKFFNERVLNLQLGNDGKTFDNYSKTYETKFKKFLEQQVEEILKKRNRLR